MVWQLDIVGDDQIAHRAVGSAVALATKSYLRAILRDGFQPQTEFAARRQTDDNVAAQQGRVEVDVHRRGNLSLVRAWRRAAPMHGATLRSATKQILKETTEASATTTAKLAKVEAAKGVSATGTASAEATSAPLGTHQPHATSRHTGHIWPACRGRL